MLLLQGAGPAGEVSAAAALRGARIAVSTESTDGYAAMLDSAHLAEYPGPTVERTIAWLGEPDLADDASMESPEVVELPECALDHDGVSIREQPFPVGDGEEQMFGILTRPALPAPEVDTCLVFLPAMAERCIGPNRLWVELARRHAARGIPSLRVDLLAVGDSDGDPAVMHSYRTVFDAARIAQIRRVLDVLQERGLGDRFTLVGLCSGGYWALNAAWVDDRVRDLIVLNPAVSAAGHAFIMRDAASRPLRKLLRTATWGQILRREVSLRGGAREAARGLRFLMAGARRRSPALEAAAITDPGRTDPAREETGLRDPALPDATGADLAPGYRELVERIDRRGGEIGFAVCAVEPGHRLLEIEGLLGGPVPGLAVTVLDSHDHNLRAYGDQLRAHALADRQLARHERRPRAPAPLSA